MIIADDFNQLNVNSYLDGDCKYYSTLQFSNIINSKKKNELVMMHFNIRSLPNKENKSKIETLLEQLPEIPDVMAFSETKINSSNIDLVNIAKYQFEHNDSLSNAGGVGLHIRENLQYFVRTDISIDSPSCENLFVEIMFNSNSTNTQSNKFVIVGVIYRHPGGSYANFQEKLISIIHKFNKPNTQLAIFGDFNIDVSKQISETKLVIA